MPILSKGARSLRCPSELRSSGGSGVSQSARPLRLRRAGPTDVEGSYVQRARWELIGLLALLLVTLAVSFLKGQDIFIFAYIMTVVVAVGAVRRRGRPWSELGIKPGFIADLRRVWYLTGLDAVVLQVLPPTVGLAFLLGFGPELVDHITTRLPVDVGSTAGLAEVGSLLVVALVLTLIEEVVFRVTFQERLSWFLGTPAAILVAAILFGLVHAVGTTGSPQVILSDVAGVTLDGIFFGLIYARTHNLLVTWATHYAADVVGLLALLTVFRA
jgi:membrane protease YdiL (CAAX protease family)